MAFVKVGSIAQLPPGSVMEAEVGGNTYAVCNADGELHALDGVCPHAGGPLGQGALHGSTLVCPWHAWEYDCRTGLSDLDEDLRVERFAVRTEGDDILIDVP
ncbi:MAG TPA: Rieske (2Fe-2S) protein [Bryobacteraceae bacterium]|jgi:nitrite reductase/ring-hydroxylating ferredoxin subunit